MSIRKFWLKTSQLVDWGKKPKIAFKKKSGNYFEWFPDGKLNIFTNCIANNLNSKMKNKVAFYNINKNKEITSYSYQSLANIINNFSKELIENLHSKLNTSKVIIHGSASLETAVAMLSCAKLGIHFSVIFEDLAPEAISKRIDLIKPDLFITRFESKKLSIQD